MNRFCFVAVTIAMSIASTAVAAALREELGAILTVGAVMAVISGGLSFIAAEASSND